MRYESILLFGAPGSGKGTQGKIIGTIPGFYHSATGDIFRSLDLQSEMGRIFWEYAGKGKLVPDEITIRLWKQYIKGMEMINQFHPNSEILVLDGIPRNLEQARLLDETIEVVKVIHLICTDMSKMVERLRRRAEGKPFRRCQRRGDSPASGSLRAGHAAGVELLPGGPDRARGGDDVADPRIEQAGGNPGPAEGTA